MSTVKNFNNMVLSEVLQAINDDVSLLDSGQPFAYVANSAIARVFAHGYIPELKFLLPEGDPPYNQDERRPGMTPNDLLYVIRKNRFSYFVDPTIDQRKRERMFIMLLETVCNDEGKVLLAIKDQTVDLLYPNITYEVLEKAGYLPARSEQEVKKANSKSKSTEEDKVQNESNVGGSASKTRSKPATKRRSTSNTTKRSTTIKTKENVDVKSTP